VNLKARLSTHVMLALLCLVLSGCGPFVVTETEYDAFGDETASETVEYNDGGSPRVLSESGDVPESAIGNDETPEYYPSEQE
jgi:hypothetical protein